MLTASHGLVCWAEQTMPSSLAAVLMATMPIWVVLLSWLLFRGSRPQPMTLAGLLAGVLGVLLLVPALSGTYPASGVLALMVAPALWALGALLATRFGTSSSTLRSTSLQMLVGGGALAITGLLRGESPPLSPAEVSPRVWLAFGYLVVFGAIVAFGTYRWLLEHVGPAAASTHAFVNPMVALVLGAALLDETLSARSAVGGSLIVLAVALIVGAGRLSAVKARLVGCLHGASMRQFERRTHRGFEAVPPGIR
jgi:drug/metabolite transporter (DMT)-like permease